MNLLSGGVTKRRTSDIEMFHIYNCIYIYIYWFNSWFVTCGRVFTPVGVFFSHAAGFDENNSGHSFCKGGALYLVSLGVPLTQVKERGNWKAMGVC